MHSMPTFIQEHAMHIRVTERSIFRNCKRRWHLQFVEGLKPHNESPNLWFGSGIHYCLERYYRDPERKWETLYDSWLEYVAYNPKGGEWFEEMRKLGPNILRVYWHFDLEQNPWEVLAVEKKIRLPILNPDTKEPVPGAFLSGMLDLVIRTPAGGVAIVDHKTSRQINSNLGLEVDDQLTSYAYMLWRETGIVPEKVIYNTILKSERGAPVLLKGGGLSTAKNQKTTYEVYLHTLQKMGLSPSEYAEILNHLSEHPAVIRQAATRTLHELEAYERQLFEEHREMEYAKEHPNAAYPNAATFGCSFCPLLTLCKAMNVGADVEFIKKFGYERTDPHANCCGVTSSDSGSGTGDENKGVDLRSLGAREDALLIFGDEGP